MNILSIRPQTEFFAVTRQQALNASLTVSMSVVVTMIVMTTVVTIIGLVTMVVSLYHVGIKLSTIPRDPIAYSHVRDSVPFFEEFLQECNGPDDPC